MAVRIGSALVDRVRESPNGRVRSGEERLEFVIIHGTWMADDEAALARLCDPAAEVSCHYYINRDGTIVQLVGEERVAFHAGKSMAVGVGGEMIEGLNGWSIGIEIGNRGPFVDAPTPADEAALQPGDWALAEPYGDVQYAALVALLEDILVRNPGISTARVLGHSDVSAGRKSDPGAHFDWQRLVNAGVCERDG